MDNKPMTQTESRLWPAQSSSNEAAKQAAARKNRYYGLLYREMADRRRAEDQLRVNYGLLSTLSHAQLRFLSGAELHLVFKDLLGSLIEVTDSSYGFISDAELQETELDTDPAYAVTTLAHILPETAASVEDVLDDLAKAVLLNNPGGRPLISSGSFPGNSETESVSSESIGELIGAYTFLGLPLFAGDHTVGVLALGGRADGYDDEIVELLQTVQTACTQMILAKGADEHRRRAEKALSDQQASLTEQVAERTAELRMVNAELQHAVRVKDEFLATVNHELRTPLNAMLLLTEVLFRGIYGDLNEKQRRSVKDIADSGRHLLSLITDILDVSKNDAGKLDLDIAPCDVRSVCNSSMQLIQGMAQKSNIRIELSISDDVQTILADARRLKQMLVNLLSNAVKFTPANGFIGLEVVGDAVREELQFTIWDTGIGIAHEDMDRLFQPFEQIDTGHTRQYSGSGLGLVLVSNMAKLHGGEVTVKSDIDQGSRFTITLPWQKVEDEVVELESIDISQSGSWVESTQQSKPDSVDLPEIEPLYPGSTLESHPEEYGLYNEYTNGSDATIPANNGASEEPTPAESLSQFQENRPPTILIVDDNEPNVDALAEYLCIHDCELAVAHDGLDAIRKASQLKPALILMDVQMPEMDGIEATRRIRQIPELADSAIVGLTANVMPGNQERCMAAGMTDFLGKPVDLDELDRIIHQYTGADAEVAVETVQGARTDAAPGDD